MKRISIILTAFALAVTMTQCKKNEGQTTSNDEIVTITLDVKQNNGLKVVVNPNTGTVDFETGDKIYVGSGGKYVGFLTHNGTNFSGNITNPTENQPLQFYFLGNVTPQETLSAGTTEECSVVISDQTEHLPVISCAASNESYVSGVTAYTAHLLNKCALVKFNVTTPSNSPICITGMKNKVTVDFTQNTMTPSMDGEGIIKLPAGAGEIVEKWAILLPQEALEEGEEGSVYSEDGSYLGIRPAISNIVENGYLPNGFVLSIDIHNGVPIGAIDGLFSVSATKQVYFSKGNLQFIGSESPHYWKFADNQWDYFGDYGNGSNFQNADRDLFGWGTSGYNHGATCYQPWSMNDNTEKYYAYGVSTYNLYDQTGQADWGYNAISNGGNVTNQWRTLTVQEWRYLLNIRNTISGILYAKARVNGINGVIILPDDWENSYYNFNNYNSNTDFTYNTISLSIWRNVFEVNGAVFLPAAGYRTSSTTSYGGDGIYWSSSVYNTYSPYCFRFKSNMFSPNSYSYGRNYGVSVRLVQDY